MNLEINFDEIDTLLYDQKRKYPKNQIEYFFYEENKAYPFKYEMVSEPFPTNHLRVHHENISAMKKLYQKMPDEPQKAGFIGYLRSKILDGEFGGLEYYLLEFLIKIHRLDQVFTYWEIFNNEESLRKLHSLIWLEPMYFSPKDLDDIRKKIKRELDSSNNLTVINASKKLIYDLIMAKKRDSLYQQLAEKENPEINSDVERIMDEINYFDFPKPLNTLLLELESLYEKATTEKEYNDVADKVRKLLDQLIMQVSDQVSHLKNEKMAKGKEPAPVRRRQFLNEQGLITSKEKELLDKIYSFVSAEGPHSLRSSAERTRISKNIVIEVILYLLRRLHEFKAEVCNQLKA